MYNKYSKENEPIVREMLNIGLHMSNKGFDCILCAVKLIHKRNGYIRTMDLYKSIGEELGEKPHNIERRIRSEIDRYYLEAMEIPELLMSDPDKGKLTNTEFLSRLTYIVHMSILGKV